MTRVRASDELSRRRLLCALSIAGPVLALGCPKRDQSLVLVGGRTVDAHSIDGQPLNLLPSGALVLGQLDAQALFKTYMGGQTAQIIANVLPLGRESNFDPGRDVQRVLSAIYAMQGADFVALLQGHFDVLAITRAADARVQTPSGAPLVRTRYGDWDIYTVANVGFVMLTPQTVLSGNETGIRRAIDRLRFGQIEPSLAPWMHELLGDRNAAFAMVGDVSGQGVIAAVGERLPFVVGLRLVRILGNFQPPGMNMVGSFTYVDEEAAKKGAEGLTQLQQLAYLASLIASWGLGGKTPELDVALQGTNVAFATQIDTGTISLLLGLIQRFTSPPAQQQQSWWG